MLPCSQIDFALMVKKILRGATEAPERGLFPSSLDGVEGVRARKQAKGLRVLGGRSFP